MSVRVARLGVKQAKRRLRFALVGAALCVLLAVVLATGFGWLVWFVAVGMAGEAAWAPPVFFLTMVAFIASLARALTWFASVPDREHLVARAEDELDRATKV